MISLFCVFSIILRGVHTVLHRAILPRTFVRVRPSRRRTRTKVRLRVRVRRPPTVFDFLYVVHVYDVQMYELAVFSGLIYRLRSKSNGVFTRYTQ